MNKSSAIKELILPGEEEEKNKKKSKQLIKTLQGSFVFRHVSLIEAHLLEVGVVTISAPCFNLISQFAWSCVLSSFSAGGLKHLP